jgi:hypothetical protein
MITADLSVEKSHDKFLQWQRRTEIFNQYFFRGRFHGMGIPGYFYICK